MEVYADASVATCYPSPASQLQAGEGPSPAAEERSSAMDDAAPTEQSAFASSSAVAQLVMDKALQSQGEPVNQRPQVDGAATWARVMLTDQRPRS